ncbi:hypothetical protein EJ08DRAFT_736555 [Tothia fuscella]|uniref:Mediator of RNA polymerase II transcription subunit 4 n=1 Tax=Tothia fuscella TaxID=1048955 RepID=A0A9P4NL77_9PEZI|nr:hypothetical protein EJ08DRAFT_736555 [Tothia fuscella]
MDAILDERFQGLETALNALIESITTYNPTITASTNLTTAEDNLTDSLNQLTGHQANHVHILQLRQTAEALDAQIKSSISLLADTRKELLSKRTESSGLTRDVPFDELLAYAKRISRFTLPPNYRPAPQKPEEPIQISIEESGQDVIMSNGVALEAPSSNAPPLEEGGTSQENPPSQDKDKDQDSGTAYAALSTPQKEWLEQLSKTPFIPWPNEIKMQEGALMQCNSIIRKGEDPWKTLTPAQRAAAEKEKQEREEKDRKDEEEFVRQRRNSGGGRAGGGGGGTRPAVPQADFGLYDPENDDEE